MSGSLLCGLPHDHADINPVLSARPQNVEHSFVACRNRQEILIAIGKCQIDEFLRAVKSSGNFAVGCLSVNENPNLIALPRRIGSMLSPRALEKPSYPPFCE